MTFKPLRFALLFVAMAVPCVGAASEPTYFSFYGLTSADPDESSSMTGECWGDEREVYCDVAHVTVTQGIKPEEIDERRRAMESEIKQLMQSSDGGALVEDFITQVCASDTFGRPMDEALAGLSAEQSARFNHPFLSHIKEFMPMFFEACNDKDPERIRLLIANTMRQEFERQTKTCKVTASVTSKEGPYRRAGSNSWVYTTGPSGACNAVTTMSFERDSETRYGWTYSQTMTHASGDNEFCEKINELVGIRHVWSWLGMGTSNKTRKMECEYIEF